MKIHAITNAHDVMNLYQPGINSHNMVAMMPSLIEKDRQMRGRDDCWIMVVGRCGRPTSNHAQL